MAEAQGRALILSDAVARDPGTGKVTLYGVFDRIWSNEFPAVHPLFAIFWRCAVPGPGRAGAMILKPDGSTLTELEPVETNKDTLHELEGTYTLGNIEFPVEGTYSVVLTYNGKEVLRTPLLLIRKNSK